MKDSNNTVIGTAKGVDQVSVKREGLGDVEAVFDSQHEQSFRAKRSGSP